MNNDFYKSQVGKYFAVRTYSHTDHRQLWKVLTRPADLNNASIYAEMEQKKVGKKQEAFVVKIVSETEDEISRDRELRDAWHKGYEECLRRIKVGEQHDFSKV